MKNIFITTHPRGGLLIKGFEPKVAMAMCLKISAIDYKSLYYYPDGTIWRMAQSYTVYTTAMSFQLALRAIGENPRNYSFKTDINKEAILIGNFNKKLKLNSFNFTDEQFREIGKVDKPIGALLANPNLKTEIPYYLVDSFDRTSLNEVAVTSSIFQFTNHTPIFSTQVDSGGRSMDEGFMMAVISRGKDGFYPYLAVCNEGEEVDERDLAENHSNSSFLLLKPQRTVTGARQELLKKYDECVNELKLFVAKNKDIKYLNERIEWGEGFDDMTNFMQSFGYCFDNFDNEFFIEGRVKLSKILESPFFRELETDSNLISIRELDFFQNSKEFKSFDFVSEY